MRRKMIMMAAICVMLLGISGCGQAEQKLESTVSKVEQEASKILSEDKAAIEGFIATLTEDVKKIQEGIEMDGKATLEVLKEDEQTIKYQFTLAEEAAATEVSELEAKAAGLEKTVQEHLEGLKETGVADAKAVVQFVNQEGKELYSKIFQ